MTDGQIHPLNESGVQSSREAQSLSAGFESVLCSKAHYRRDTNQLAPPIAFLHLAVDQASRHLPPANIAPATAEGEPLTKVSREPHRSRD